MTDNVADDYAFIAKRLKELQDEREREAGQSPQKWLGPLVAPSEGLLAPSIYSEAFWERHLSEVKRDLMCILYEGEA